MSPLRKSISFSINVSYNNFILSMFLLICYRSSLYSRPYAVNITLNIWWYPDGFLFLIIFSRILWPNQQQQLYPLLRWLPEWTAMKAGSPTATGFQSDRANPPKHTNTNSLSQTSVTRSYGHCKYCKCVVHVLISSLTFFQMSLMGRSEEYCTGGIIFCPLSRIKLCTGLIKMFIW